MHEERINARLFALSDGKTQLGGRISRRKLNKSKEDGIGKKLVRQISAQITSLSSRVAALESP